jgi:hypothetical protein
MVCVLVYEGKVGVDPSLLYTSGMNMMVCVLVYEGEVEVDPSLSLHFRYEHDGLCVGV